MTSRPHILISGGGLGGLTAALALTQRGFDVDLYEQASQLREIGAGVQLGPNAVKVLYSLGLERKLRDLAVSAKAKEIRIWNSGKTVPLFDLGAESVSRYGAPYLMMHRADLHDILLEALLSRKPGALHLGCRGQSFEQTSAGVTLKLANGTHALGDILVGADGLHSQIRRQIAGEERPEFTGGICWRGLIPTADLPVHLRRLVGTNWIGPGGHVITYPVRGGQFLNFVGHIERGDWQVESWTEPGTKSECAADFAGWHPDIHTMIGSVDVPFKWALFLRTPLTSWRDGKVTLLGDACHATLPYLAQGANMAIEDGLVLARALNEYPAEPELALERYERARVDRTRKVVLESAQNLTRFHRSDLTTDLEVDRYTSTELTPDAIRKRYDWLFEYDATTVQI